MVFNLHGTEEDLPTAARSVLANASPTADLIAELATYPQTPMPLEHRFQSGIYLREILMPADTFVIGHVHRHEHWNIILTGRALVSMEGEMKEVCAGDVIKSGPLVQKTLYIIEDMRWLTVHHNPGNLTDIERLEDEIVHLSPEMHDARKGMTLDEFRMQLPEFVKRRLQS